MLVYRRVFFCIPSWLLISSRFVLTCVSSAQLSSLRFGPTACKHEAFASACRNGFVQKLGNAEKLFREKNDQTFCQRDTGGARIIERSQEYKSTVKYRTFVLLRVPIPRGVGKFNYRTGIRSIIKFPRSIIKFPRSLISGTDLIFTAYLYTYNL